MQNTSRVTQFFARRSTRVAVVVSVASLTLGACGGGSTGTATGAPTAAAPTATASRTPRTPGVSGLIAAVDGSTMQVQTQSKQTAVTWTPTTVFAQLTPGALADVTTGSCITVRADATGSDAAAAGGPVTAVSVSVSPAVAGAAGCLSGDARGQGGLPAGATGRPSRPTGDGPGGTDGPGPGGPGGRGSVVIGVVTGVGGQGFTVEGLHIGGFATPGAGAGASPTTASIEVTTSAQTTVTVTRAAAGADVKVGGCANAQGAADPTGAITATRIVLSAAVQGACTGGGFGGFGPGGGPRATGGTS